MVRGWLDSWTGVWHVVDAMHKEGYNLRLMRSSFTRSADFARDGVDALPQWIGRAHDAAPWRAVQHAALDRLRWEKDQRNAGCPRSPIWSCSQIGCSLLGS
jgi:hypothetical protein